MEISNILGEFGICNTNQTRCKENPFCMSSNELFVKDGLHDNHWVNHSVINHVDAVEFQNRNSKREGNDESSGKF